jgi:hypothetical protein
MLYIARWALATIASNQCRLQKVVISFSEIPILFAYNEKSKIDLVCWAKCSVRNTKQIVFLCQHLKKICAWLQITVVQHAASIWAVTGSTIRIKAPFNEKRSSTFLFYCPKIILWTTACRGLFFSQVNFTVR